MSRVLAVLLICWCGLAYGASASVPAVVTAGSVVVSDAGASSAAEPSRVLAGSSLPQKPATSVTLSQGFDFAALGQLLAGLVLVLVVFLGLAWLLKRTGMAGGFSQQGLKVVASLPLSSRERVVLIQAGSKQLLLGVAAGRVNLLESFEQPLVESATTPQQPFSHWLQKAMNRSAATESSSRDKGGAAGE